MKVKIAFALLVIWGLGSAYWIFLKPSSSSTATVTSADPLKEVEFVKDFMLRYTGFDKASFFIQQNGLLNYLSEPLRSERAEYLERAKRTPEDSIQEQKSELLKLSRNLKTNSYNGLLLIRWFHQGKQVEIFGNFGLDLKSVDSSALNPWGFQIVRMDFTQSKIRPAFDSTVNLSSKELNLRFPCPLDGLRLKPKEVAKVRVTTFDVSEVEISKVGETNDAIELEANCGTKEFHISLKSNAETEDLYVSVPQALGKNPTKARSQIEKKLEEEFDFIIDK